MLSRRKLLQHVANGSSLMLMPRLVLASAEPTKYELVAELTTHRFKPESKGLSSLWLYNGSSPGPMLTATRGDEIFVKFTNRLEQPTTIHWHGIRNINEMDGIPNVTQAAVEPGESFTYRFPVKDAGTFWYHAHNKAWEQVARGLYGALIVKEAQNVSRERDVVLIADDWRLNKDYALDEESFGNLHDWSHGGRLGNWLTINGQSEPHIFIPDSGQIRLRFINAANARKLAFQLANRQQVKVISLDGAPCEPFNIDTIKLGPAQRMDVLVDITANLNALNEVSTRKKFAAARFLFLSDSNVGVSRVTIHDAKPWYPMPKLENAKIVKIHMQGGAMGNLNSAQFQGEERPLRDLAAKNSKVWAFNGKIGGYDLEIAKLSLGETSILRIWNDTNWDHAMHLHGHHFWVESKEFGDSPKHVLRDTYVMTPGERADLVFIADNPGLWLFHCHTLEHHAAGMGGVISVT